MAAIERRRPWAAGKSAKPATTPRPPEPLEPAASKSATARKPKRLVRRFVFTDGASKKFWEIHVQGPCVTTRYGRIGTEGQSTTKTYSGPSIAEEEAAKVVHQKRRKGYTEVPTP